MKPSCVITQAAANYISRNFKIDRDNFQDSEAMGELAKRIYKELEQSGLATYFTDTECALMLVNWATYRYEDIHLDMLVEQTRQLATSQPEPEGLPVPRRIRNPVVRYKPTK